MKRTLRRTYGTLFGVGSAAVAVVTVVACQAIDGIHTYAYDNPETSVVYQDGGVVTVLQDGGVMYTGFGDAACVLAKPPVAPVGAPDQPNGLYVLVFSRLSFTGNAATVVGYDIDGVCTGEQTVNGTGSSSCVPPAGQVAPEDVVGPNGEGVDSVVSASGGPLQNYFNGVTLDGITKSSIDIAEGEQSAYIVVSEFNGTINDSQVSVAFATTEELQSIGCGFDAISLLYPDGGSRFVDGGDPAPDGGTYPRTDGCDVWQVDHDSLLFSLPDGGAKTYQYTSDQAWVSNGTLVATFSRPLTFSVGNIDLSPHSPTLVAKLQLVGFPGGGDPDVDSGNDWQLDAGLIRITDGLIQGRLPAIDFVRALGSVTDPYGTYPDAGICPGQPTFIAVKNAICENLDVNSDASDGVGAPCDGFSFASTFDAVTAGLGDVVDGSAHPSQCDGAPVVCGE